MGTPNQRHGAQIQAKAEEARIIATNNSSIVSKRSVERLYYPDEPHFFRFFVNKFQRRAPLINRGYHFRLHVIDVTLRNFLRRPSSKPKVVVNLGCGSDVIPWQCWTRYPAETRGEPRVTFVDVDFPDMIERKRQIVLETPDLVSHLSHVDTRYLHPHVMLRSDAYCQIGIDLRHTAALEAALAFIVDIRDCDVLFVAEVSITYMETDDADGVIHWASTISPTAEFCLLEQILPDGPDHPFATTMTSHFLRLGSPIKSVSTYSTIPQQYYRFRERGWTSVDAQSLWSAWSSDAFITLEERQILDTIEPFDEFEEFALFASHYILVHTRNYGVETMTPKEAVSHAPSTEVDVVYKGPTGRNCLRRFGSAILVTDELFGDQAIINILGAGNNTRLSSYDVYTRQDHHAVDLRLGSPGGPCNRVAFTTTDVGSHGVLLVGGRASPTSAMRDCWVFKKHSLTWERTFDLPTAVYRHSACRLGDSCSVLVLGGRSGQSGTSDLIAVYHPSKGWLRCSVSGSTLSKSVYGAVLTCAGRKTGDNQTFYGFFAGGLTRYGLLDRQVLMWELSFDEGQQPVITFVLINAHTETICHLSRFGSAQVQFADSSVVLGGVSCDGTISREDEIVVFSTSEANIEAVHRLVIPESGIPRPLIIGSSVVMTHDGNVAIIGGAATCFSMGTFWTKGAYTLRLPGAERRSSSSGWDFSHSGELVQSSPPPYHPRTQNQSQEPVEVKSIRRITLSPGYSFQNITADGAPVIIQGLDLGPCLEKWDMDYLVNRVGPHRKVTVHESRVQNMDFNAKNFRYITMEFGDFVREAQKGKRLYLRALSAEAPANQPASLEQDFPTLASDFSLPQQLQTVKEDIHSCVLRVSGPVNMWLHYDVQANVYCQISGSKRMILFPPSDVSGLGFAPGASSSSVDVFSSSTLSILRNTKPQEAELRPGDVLYLPPFWLHTATPTSDTSVAVNVFFRSLDASQYTTGRDVYGNRDLPAYEKGRQDVNKIANMFNKVPTACRQFYLLRLAQELGEKSKSSE